MSNWIAIKLVPVEDRSGKLAASLSLSLAGEDFSYFPFFGLETAPANEKRRRRRRTKRDTRDVSPNKKATLFFPLSLSLSSRCTASVLLCSFTGAFFRASHFQGKFRISSCFLLCFSTSIETFYDVFMSHPVNRALLMYLKNVDRFSRIFFYLKMFCQGGYRAKQIDRVLLFQFPILP